MTSVSKKCLFWYYRWYKFKIGDHVRISKYKNIFTKGYAPNWPEEVIVIISIKNTLSWI